MTRRVELTIVTVVLCVGTWIGVDAVRAFRATGGVQDFYQAKFGPAVMLACGRGFQDPDTGQTPALAAFLAQRVNAIDCADLPQSIPVSPLDAFQRGSRYLELAVALTWKITGVSWSRLVVLPGILFGAVAALSYGLFRLALSRVLALAGAVLTLTSTPNLMLVPQLRDYAKGPFLLAVILIMGLLVVGPTDRRRAVVLSAVAGVVVGLGLGFRSDVMIAVPPFLLTVAFLLPAAVSIRMRAAAAVVFLVVFVVVAYPLLGDSSKGSNFGHVILLGLMAPFDEPLGIHPSVYEFGGQYNDSLAFSTINSYAVRVEDRRQGVDLATVEYERAGTRYLSEIATVFPGDLVTRTLAAIGTVPRYFLDHSLYPPPWVRSTVVRGFLRLRASVSSRLAPVAVAALVTATIVISTANPRAAWLIVLVMAGFAGATAIQFHERHFYYLQLAPWLAFGLLAQTAIRTPTWLGRVTALRIRPTIVLCATLLVGGGSLIAISRAYQQRGAARLFESYITAPRTPLPLVQRDAGSGRVLLAAQDFLQPLPPDAPRINTRFLAVQFRDDLCGPGNLAMTIRYQATLPELDFSEPLTVQLRGQPAAPTVVFLAAYDRPDDSSRFRGIEVPAEQSRCVAGLSRVDRLDRTPLLLTTMLAADWRQEPLHQRLR